MFYKWKRIKIVMSELYDPRDKMKNCGIDRLPGGYAELCTDRNVYDAFVDICIAESEGELQVAAKVWHNRVIATYPKLVGQINEVLCGTRKELV
jgi:hypothetical protein